MSTIWDAGRLITARQAAEFYGIRGGHGQKFYCPFHQDGRTPNLSFKDRWFTCFACGAHGDSIEYVGRLFDLMPLDAARKISADFGLGLDDSRPDPDAARAWKLKRAAEEARKEREKRAFDTLCRADRYINQITDEEPDEIASALLARIERWQPLLDLNELPEWAYLEVKTLDGILARRTD